MLVVPIGHCQGNVPGCTLGSPGMAVAEGKAVEKFGGLSRAPLEADVEMVLELVWLLVDDAVEEDGACIPVSAELDDVESCDSGPNPESGLDEVDGLLVMQLGLLRPISWGLPKSR